MSPLVSAAFGLACLAIGFIAGAAGGPVFFYQPAPVAPAQPAEVVRVLDIVIRDSNTTNRRQRFECRPANQGRAK